MVGGKTHPELLPLKAGISRLSAVTTSHVTTVSARSLKMFESTLNPPHFETLMVCCGGNLSTRVTYKSVRNGRTGPLDHFRVIVSLVCPAKPPDSGAIMPPQDAPGPESSLVSPTIAQGVAQPRHTFPVENGEKVDVNEWSSASAEVSLES